MDTIRTVIDATRTAVRDPEDTSQVFRIAEALNFGAPRRIARRFRRKSPALIARKPDLLERLSDRAWLESLPQGSLGRAYLDFIDSEGISADGLVEASIIGRGGAPLDGQSDIDWAKRRIRDTHDLWHTVTGYRGDLLGEAALLAFTFAQTRHPGVGFLAGVSIVLSTVPIRPRPLVVGGNAPAPSSRAERRLARQFIVDGFRRGHRANWFVDAPWEQLLEQPLESVRAQLGVRAVPPYEQVRPGAVH